MNKTETVTGEVAQVIEADRILDMAVPRAATEEVLRRDGYLVVLQVASPSLPDRILPVSLSPPDHVRDIVLTDVDFAVGDEVTMEIDPLTDNLYTSKGAGESA